MEKQKLPPPVSTKITRKLASQSTEHNSLLNFYSSISTDETGAPKRWKMSSSVNIDEDEIASGKISPVPSRSTSSRDRSPAPPQKNTSSRESSTERKGRLSLKRGGKEKDLVDSTNSRESSLEGKDKGKMSSDSKRDSSADSKKGKKSGKKIVGVDKSTFYSSFSKAKGDKVSPKKRRPKSLDLNAKQVNGEDESFKSPDPLTPCNIAIKRRKGRPKETPPTLVAESPVDSVAEMSSDVTLVDFDTEELMDADIEDNIEPTVKKKTMKMSKVPKKRATATVLGRKKHLKGRILVAKFQKGGGSIKKIKIESQIPEQLLDNKPEIKRKAGRPPGAKNKATLLREQMAKLSKKAVKPELQSLSVESIDEAGGNIQDKATESIKTDSDITTSIGIENSETDSKLKVGGKSKVNRTLGVKQGGIKSLGKVKKEGKEVKKVIKKRILNSYATNIDNKSSLDHLPKNDLRRYLQMKLIERLNGNRSNSLTIMKTIADKEVKSDQDETLSDEDSLAESDPMKGIDIQNLSALVEQKRIGLESDVSVELRQSVGRTRKSSVDHSKISDNESVSSEKSANSINSTKRIFVLGENNADSDDTIRTRQRVEIVPGKSRKRTLSGEFDLVDENQLRKEKKLARLSGPGVNPFLDDLEGTPDEGGAENTPVVTPVKVQVKTSPKVTAIKQRLQAKKEPSSPFVSEHRKRLLKQSPFLTRIRKTSVPGNRLIDVPTTNKGLLLDEDDGVFSVEPKAATFTSEPNVMQEGQSVLKKKNEVITDAAVNTDQNVTGANKGVINTDSTTTTIGDLALEPECSMDVNGSYEVKMTAEIHSTESERVTEQNESTEVTINQSDEKVYQKDISEEKPFLVESEVNEMLMELISKVVYTCEPELKDRVSPVKEGTCVSTEEARLSIDSNKIPSETIVVKRKKGRPKKKKTFFVKKKISTQPVAALSGARRGRKPKSSQPKESPESTVVRKIELRQKISRSPLDNIALKQSIEENEYIKNEVQRANKKEAKEAKIRSKRAHALAIEEQTNLLYERYWASAPTELYQTELMTESEMSDAGLESGDQTRTTDYYLAKCKPCSVVLTDFIKQLQLAQQKVNDSMDEDTEAEESVDDSVDNSEGLGDTDTDRYEGADELRTVQEQSDELDTPQEGSDESKKQSVSPKDKSNSSDIIYETLKDVLDKNPALETKTKAIKLKTQGKKKSPGPKKIRPQHQTARKSTDHQKHGITLEQTPPNKNLTKTTARQTPEHIRVGKTPEHQTARKSIDHQTARKTVPPLKIKLKGGMRKTYMVEPTVQALDLLASPPAKPPKKRKSKSSSKSGSDSDRANKGHHHHHHHKKRNKSPLVGQVGSFGEKKSKPTAIVAASPSIKPSPHVPKDPYEATFLEFIQQKEKDIARLPVQNKPLYDMLNNKEYKDDNGSLMVTASSQSKTITSLASVIESKTQASLYSSISKNTSLVNSIINDNLNKVLESNVESAQKKDAALFIGVMGSRSNLHYFCSLCENEMHKTDDLVLKHFALIHPGEPIMYRRVAETNPTDQLGPSNTFDKVSNPAQDEPVKKVLQNENTTLNTSGDTTMIPSQTGAGVSSQSNTSSSHVQPLYNSRRTTDRDEDEESDTGSLNLKIVEVVSLKDKFHPIDDPEEVPLQEKQPEGKGQGQQDNAVTNVVYTPELKIPHFPRSSSHSRERTQEASQSSQQPHEEIQIVQTTSALKSAQRKPPGLITPGKLCNTFKCEKCNVHAPVLAAMVAHLRNTHHDIPRLFQCPYCRDKEAESEAQIHQHIRKYHPTDNPNPPVALSEKAKGNLRTLSVRVPDNKANDASFLEKDIYMCLNCKIHMPSLEAIYDHLEQVHTEVFVFVCSSCKVFKSKTEKVVLQHIQNEPRCNTLEKNISLAIDGNQFTRVPCLIKDKNKHKEKHSQPKVSQSLMQGVVSKQTSSHVSVPQSHGQSHVSVPQSHGQSHVSVPQTHGLSHVNIPQSHGQSHGGVPQSHGLTHVSVSQSHVSAPQSHSITLAPSSIVQALQTQPFNPPQFIAPGLPMQQLFPYPFGQMLAQPVINQLQHTNQFIPMPVSQPSLVISSVSTTTSTLSLTTLSTNSSPTTTSSSSSASSSVPVSSVNSSVSTAPSKPTGAKKRKNLLESIQHIKMQKQLEQQAKLDKTSDPTPSILAPAASSSSSVTESISSSQAPPPLIRGPPPLIRFDQLNQIPLSAAVPLQPGVIPQHTVKQVSAPLQLSKSDAPKQVAPRRQIQSSLFDTSDPEAFKPIQRTPVLNVPSITRPIRAHVPSQLSVPKSSQQKPASGGYTPLDLSKTTPTQSPASTPPAPEKPATQITPEVPNPEVYNVFNLKPSTQAQLPKQALQSKTAVHQLPPKAPGPPMPVRPNASNTLAYRPQQPHVATSQVPQVINMPLGMLNNISNLVVTMPSFQVVQGMPVQAMPAQFIRMSGAQLISSPTGPGNVPLGIPAVQGERPVLATQQGGFQQPMNVNLPVFKCPYCPKLLPLTFAQVQPHIESQHPGCSVVFMPMMENKK